MVTCESDMQGFSLKLLKHLVLDEADRLLNMDFEQEIDQILKAIPKVLYTHTSHTLVRSCIMQPDVEADVVNVPRQSDNLGKVLRTAFA